MQEQIFDFVKDYLGEFHLSRLALKRGPINRSIWKPPEQGQIKINVDGAFYNLDGTGAAVAIARDSLGAFISPRCKKWAGLDCALLAEVYAFKLGLQLAESLQVQSIILENNSSIGCECLPSSLLCRASLCFVIDEVNVKLNSFAQAGVGSHFPIQNLPYDVFKPDPTSPHLPDVAIREYVLDLSEIASVGLFDGPLLRGSDSFHQVREV
ncbi:hypothetical protein Drorol1_Dr00015993 [Drosera rotundifolia]